MSVISHHSQHMGDASFRIFDEKGGVIGRSAQCDWVLEDPDSVLSSRHAIIRSIQGMFFIEDTSTNGTGLNSLDSLLPRGEPTPLADGDRLYLGNFELLVQIVDQPAAVEPQSPPPRAALGKGGEVSTPTSPPQPDPSGAVAALLKAINLPPHLGAPAVFEQLGEIMRSVTQGIIDLLNARAEVKNQFRLAKTLMRPENNNPLKFAATGDEALHALFEKHRPSYLDPREAYREALEDLNRHHSAVLAGMQASYADLLQRLDPDTIERACEASGKSKGGLFGVAGRSPYWDYYKSYHRKIANDSGGVSQQMFGEAFTNAYDDHLQRLEESKLRRRH